MRSYQYSYYVAMAL